MDYYGQVFANRHADQKPCLWLVAGALAGLALVTFSAKSTTFLPVDVQAKSMVGTLVAAKPQVLTVFQPMRQSAPQAAVTHSESHLTGSQSFNWGVLAACFTTGVLGSLVCKLLAKRTPLLTPSEVATPSFAMFATSGDKDPDVDVAIFRPVGTLIPGERREGNLNGRFSEDFDDRLASALGMGWRKFRRELLQLGRVVLPQGEPTQDLIKLVRKLKLSNEEIDKREQARAEIPTTPPVRFIYNLICRLLDLAFEDRPIPRFWVLETVARMPYFAYMTTLHLYETLGWWRSPELRNIHQAEEDNEAHHLMIMEALGGDMRWLDRFLAQHGAIVYYWVLVFFYFVDPRYSYNFSRMLESHAVDTYGQFVDENEEMLKKIPAPPVAVDYYRTGDLYLFDKFHSTQRNKPKEEWRRPPCTTLYDVFSNIRDDELEHVMTMHACEMWVEGKKSPIPLGPVYDMDKYKETMNNDAGRSAWKEWSKGINDTLKE